MGDQHGDLRGKVIAITGGNSGIGRAAAVDLARQGATVVITARDLAKGEEALAEIQHGAGTESATLLQLDLASFDSIHDCADQLLRRFDRLDVLVNNAGGLLSERLETEQHFEATFGVNHLGHFLLTQLLLERLEASAPARIVNVSSIAHRFGSMSFADPFYVTRPYNGMQAYNQSKLANVLFTTELARRLAGTGVTVNALHPGVVASGFGNADDTKGIDRVRMAAIRPFMISSTRGAKTTVYLAGSPDVEGITGGYFVHARQYNPSSAARDPQTARQLWELSEELVAEGERARSDRS